MSKFNPPDNHEHVGLFFEQSKADYIKKGAGIEFRCVIVEGKTIPRLQTMFQEIIEKLPEAQDKLYHSVCTLQGATNAGDVLIQMLTGNVKPPIGAIICPDCLNKSIILMEDCLQALKDIKALC